MRKNEYNYIYIDPDSAYTYLGSSVLINKYNIKDRTVLEKKEYEITVNRLFDLTLRPIEVQSMSDIREIHHYLFEELYDWAGQYRKVNISKDGNAFMAMQAFDTGEQYLNQLITTYHMTAVSKEVIAHDLAVILDNLNHMHPFREGNGRTQRESIRSLALSKGYELLLMMDESEEAYKKYMSGTIHSDVQLLKEVIYDNLVDVSL